MSRSIHISRLLIPPPSICNFEGLTLVEKCLSEVRLIILSSTAFLRINCTPKTWDPITVDSPTTFDYLTEKADDK